MRKQSSLYRDLTGQEFGKWKVLGRDLISRGQTRWFCRCECGEVRSVVATTLTSHKSKCCGCDRENLVKVLVERSTTHGQTRTSEYRVWSGMISRCYTPSHTSYHLYGERGIRVCKRWKQSFEAFLSDMGKCPPGQSIGRKNNNENYTPGNCRWETDEEQANNRRTNVVLTYLGKTLTVAQWARETGLSQTALYQRVYKGWPVKRILTEPTQKKSR